MRKKYLSISEFGKICNVNRKTLIYYHNAGVFSPEKIGANGYRYYNINQYETFNILKAFRELGVSIDEIKEYLRDRNPKEYLNILDKEKERVIEKLKILDDIKQKIESKIEITEKGIEDEKNNEPYLKEFEEEELYIKNVKNGEDMEEFIQFINYCSEKNIDRGYSIGTTLDVEELENGDFLNIDKMYLKTDKGNYKKEKGIYACINHKGPYEETGRSYKKLLDFIKKNNYTIDSCSYEDSLLDFFAVKDEQDYLTRISIKIK
ncbi:MerR family transcriptional regulator [Clostridium thermobutyricum]|uniref:MerR family transcriptional regulator n=1 Tax=Clostridium thermobutyricum TaxID=29372 RepID=UPI002942A890|nr:MerR family transcriptional regulator [Clostridium thermobutyricum]